MSPPLTILGEPNHMRKITLIEKARRNRSKALIYVFEQKARLGNVTDLTEARTRRSPIPAFGFSSIRAAAPSGAAA